MQIAQFVILALLVESIVTTIAWVVESKFDWKRVTALVLSVAIALLAKIDLFAFVGLPLTLPFVGAVLTGLILARGANAFYDLYKAIKSIGKNTGDISTVLNTAYEPVIGQTEDTSNIYPTKEETLEKLNRRI